MKRVFGFTLIEVVIVLALVGILAMIAVPNVMGPRKRAYNASAVSTGHQFRSAQAIYYSQNDKYTTHLNDLLTIDKNLLDAPGVTFIWVAANSSGYTINIRHTRGDRWYTQVP